MKRIIYSVIFCLCEMTSLAYAQPKPTVQLNVDWAKYLPKQDLIWNALPTGYFEGAFVGNGLLGAILFKEGSLKNTLLFEIGRNDVYDHRQPTASAYETSRLPISKLLLTPVREIKNVQFRNNLWNAEIRGELITSAGTILFRCYVPSSEEVIPYSGKQPASFSVVELPVKSGDEEVINS